MFLSLLTADAAAQHGHEFSTSTTSTSDSRTSSPVPRSSFLNGLSASVAGIGQSTSRSPPPRPLSLSGKETTTGTDAARPIEASRADKQPMYTTSPIQSPNASPPSSPLSTVPSSTIINARMKRRLRSKTLYSFAHPPPSKASTSRHALNLRPRVLLQLQKLMDGDRPMPAIEVLPSSVFATRFGRRCARIMKKKKDGTRRKFGPDDLLVVKAGAYRMADESMDLTEVNEIGPRGDAQMKAFRGREAVGIICDVRRSNNDQVDGATPTTSGPVEFEVCMADGTIWQVSSLANGGYELVTRDEHGLQQRARWIPRPGTIRRSSSMSTFSSLENSDEKKFIFSTITPGSRRHPVIATLSRSGMEILDTYNLPDSDSSDSIKTVPELRSLITVTGIWLLFRESWSPFFSYHIPSGPPTPLENSGRTSSPDLRQARRPSRTFTLPLGLPSSRTSSRSPTPEGRIEPRRSLSRIRWPSSPAVPKEDPFDRSNSPRPGRGMLNRSASFTPSSTQISSGAAYTLSASSSPSLNPPGRARANSAGQSLPRHSMRHHEGLKISAALMESEMEEAGSSSDDSSDGETSASDSDDESDASESVVDVKSAKLDCLPETQRLSFAPELHETNGYHLAVPSPEEHGAAAQRTPGRRLSGFFTRSPARQDDKGDTRKSWRRSKRPLSLGGAADLKLQNVEDSPSNAKGPHHFASVRRWVHKFGSKSSSNGGRT